MTPTPTQVREALELHEFGVHRPKSLHDVIIPAARAWLDLFTECEKCGGQGILGIHVHTDPETGDHLGDEAEFCPACGGRGYTLQPDRVEAAAKAYEDTGVDGPRAVGPVGWEWFQDHYPDVWAHMLLQAEQAILAYLGEPRP